MCSRLWFAALSAAMCLAGCGGESSSPTTPSTTATTVTEVFTTTVPVLGSRMYAFTVASAGTVEMTLVHVGPQGTLLPTSTAIGIGIGVPNGTDCDMTSALVAQPGLTFQMRTALAAGTVCARVFDAGQLTTAASVTLRIVHP